MIACEDTSQDHLYYVHSCGFGGLWRFAGPFNKVRSRDAISGNLRRRFSYYRTAFIFLQSNSSVQETEMFVNYLEAIVETILPTDEGETTTLLSDSSTCVSLMTLSSPVDRGENHHGKAYTP